MSSIFGQDNLVGGAQSSRTRPQAQFGEVTLTPSFVHWVDRQPHTVSQEEWVKLPDSERALDVMFAIDIQGLDPQAPYPTYERKLTVGGADWNKTLLPSLAAIFGSDAITAEAIDNTLGSLNGKFIEAHDVPQQPRKNQEPGDKVYNTIAVARVFESREACAAAREERYGKREDSASGQMSAAPASDPFASLCPAEISASDWPAYVDAIREYPEDTAPATIAGELGLKAPDVIKVRNAMKSGITQEEVPF